MPYSINTNATFGGEQSKLEGAYPIDMYVLNASLSGWEPLYYVNLNQNVYGWSLNATGDTTWVATKYTGLPIERDSIGTNTQGEISEVSISIPNTNRVIEAIIQYKDYLRGRDIHFLSCFVKHLPEAAVEADDETGATWGPTVHGLSLADGSAFFRASGVDLSPYAGVAGSSTPYMLIVTDSAGKKAIGWIAEADVAEALESNLSTNGDFETLTSGTDDDGTSDNFADWLETNNDASGYKTLSITVATRAMLAGSTRCLRLNYASGQAYVRQDATVTPDKLYKVTFWTAGDGTRAGRYQFYDGSNSVSITGANISTGVTSTTWTQVVLYVTAPAGCYALRLYLVCPSTTGYADFDNVTLQEVTDAGTDGVHIVDAQNGSARNWASIEAGFDYNDSSYTFEVYNLSNASNYTGSTAYHLGTLADKNAVVKEKLYIDSVYSDEKVVKFTCRSKFNIKNIIIPRRTFNRECAWALMGKYTATECDPNNTINTASYPTCDGTLDNCRQRRNSARFGGFPAVPERGFVIV